MHAVKRHPIRPHRCFPAAATQPVQSLNKTVGPFLLRTFMVSFVTCTYWLENACWPSRPISHLLVLYYFDPTKTRTPKSFCFFSFSFFCSIMYFMQRRVEWKTCRLQLGGSHPPTHPPLFRCWNSLASSYSFLARLSVRSRQRRCSLGPHRRWHLTCSPTPSLPRRTCRQLRRCCRPRCRG